MKLLDVNVLVHAFRPDIPSHDTAFAVMSEACAGREPVLILTEVAVGFVRVVTNKAIFSKPNSPTEAMAALDAWCLAPSVKVREAGRGRWEVFRRLAQQYQLRGGDIHDGLLAAAAMSASATLITRDGGFQRFDDLQVQIV